MCYRRMFRRKIIFLISTIDSTAACNLWDRNSHGGANLMMNVGPDGVAITNASLLTAMSCTISLNGNKGI